MAVLMVVLCGVLAGCPVSSKPEPPGFYDAELMRGAILMRGRNA